MIRCGFGQIAVMAAGLGVTLSTSQSASATSPTLFGVGARSQGLSMSDVADADPHTSATTNPAFAWRDGKRFNLGYSYARVDFTIDDHDSSLRDISGIDLAAQFGVQLSEDVHVGGALVVHLPDRSVAKITFRRATEPHYPLYDVSPYRTMSDQVLALRVASFSLGLGASVVARTAGDGVRADLTQDAMGTRADSRVDIEIPYVIVPIGGLAYDLGRMAAALRFRLPTKLSLESQSTSFVDVPGNPLNGTTVATLHGDTGYEPLTIDLGVRVDAADWLRLLAALSYARWSDAPPPDARVELDLDLGVAPQQIEAAFPHPRYRDTLSPRLGVEIAPMGHVEPDEGSVRDWSPAKLALRAGWLVAPSPVPNQTGLTSHADATRHAFTAGVGYHLGRPWGVELEGNVAVGYHRLNERTFNKPSDALPNSRYTAGGDIAYGSLSFGGRFR